MTRKAAIVADDNDDRHRFDAATSMARHDPRGFGAIPDRHVVSRFVAVGTIGTFARPELQSQRFNWRGIGVMVPNEGTIFGSSLGFALAAAALLGSPGPGIAALVATGRLRGVTGGLPYFAAMQLGLMLAAAISAAGLVSIIAAIPLLYASLAIISIAYLLWLAWSVASAPLSGLPVSECHFTRVRPRR